MSFEKILVRGQGFAAFGPEFEGPPPLNVFDTLPKQPEPIDKMLLNSQMGKVRIKHFKKGNNLVPQTPLCDFLGQHFIFQGQAEKDMIRPGHKNQSTDKMAQVQFFLLIIKIICFVL